MLFHIPEITGSACRVLSSVGACALLCGCASLDSAPDRARASDLVAARAETETGWTSPWDAPAEHWDGRAALSAEAAVRIALQNNRDLRRQVEMITASRAEYVQAHLLPNPVVNVMIGIPIDGLGGEVLAASAVQQLAALWRRPAMIDAADRELQAQVLGVSDAALRVVAAVRRTHAQIVFAERAVALQSENLELLEQSSQLLRRQLAVGEASQLDVNRVELDRWDEAVRLEDRQAQLHRAQRELLLLLGRADDSCDWSTNDQPAVVDLRDLDEADIMQLAGAQRLDIAASHAIVEARSAGVDLQELGRLPDVAAGVGYEHDFGGRKGVFPRVTATVPILDNNSARVARARSQYQQALIDADSVRQKAVAEARTAWIDAQAQSRVVREFQDNILELAQSNHDLAQDAFSAGATDLTVLLEAQRQLNRARIELTDRRFAEARLSIELERAVGGSLLEHSAPVGARDAEHSRARPTESQP